MPNFGGVGEVVAMLRGSTLTGALVINSQYGCTAAYSGVGLVTVTLDPRIEPGARTTQLASRTLNAVSSVLSESADGATEVLKFVANIGGDVEADFDLAIFRARA